MENLFTSRTEPYMDENFCRYDKSGEKKNENRKNYSGEQMPCNHMKRNKFGAFEGFDGDTAKLTYALNIFSLPC